MRELAANLKLHNPPPDKGAEWLCEKVMERYPEPCEGFNVLAEALLLTRGLGVVACGTLPISKYSTCTIINSRMQCMCRDFSQLFMY